MHAEIKVAANSNVGLVRAHNEDSFMTGQHVWAVADGMGGQAAGGMASRIAIDCLAGRDRLGPLDQEELTSLLGRINHEILAYGVGHPSAAGLGTTIAGIALVAMGGLHHWLVFHIGDSRVYRLTDGRLILETIDHSEVQSLMNQGVISAAEARSHPKRNVLNRCLGSRQVPKADMRLIPYCPGDRLLICSDGLTTEVPDDMTEAVLLSAPEPKDAVDELVGGALARGGRDNITVIVVDAGAAVGDTTDDSLGDTLPTPILGR